MQDMRKLFWALLLSLNGAVASFAQTGSAAQSGDAVVLGSFWSGWYVQAGLDMSLQNPYGYKFSEVFPKGKSFGWDVAVGKWFSPEVGLRFKVNWENGFPLFENRHLEWIAPFGRNGISMDEGGYIAMCVDVRLSLKNIILGYDEERRWDILVYPRAGLVTNLATSSGSPMVGGGVGGTYQLNDRLSLYADMGYQVTTSEFYGGGSTTGMSVATGCNGYLDIQVGVQWNLGKSHSKFSRLRAY